MKSPLLTNIDVDTVRLPVILEAVVLDEGDDVGPHRSLEGTRCSRSTSSSRAAERLNIKENIVIKHKNIYKKAAHKYI